MYDIKLMDNENILLISDNSLIYNSNYEKVYTTIITNYRFLILDFPSNENNSLEDLRTSQRLTYIKKKEVILSIKLDDINDITKQNDYYKIAFNNNYILIKDNDIINKLIKLSNMC